MTVGATQRPPRYTELINFRDFGGHATTDGATVRQGLLYRCGHLAFLGDEQISRMLGMQFATIADLRYLGERETERSPWPIEYGDRILAHDGERNTEAPHMVMLRTGTLTIAGVEQFYRDFYRDLPYDHLYRPLFAQTIQRLTSGGAPALIHCAAGKDRTGMMCGIILHCLGVPRDTIIADYLKSGGAEGLLAMKPVMARRYKRRYDVDLDERAIDALLDVKPGYLQSTFDEIERRSGSVEAYLAESGVGADMLDALRRNILTA
ncbi:MAG: tyrosine-protein phosphatase [Sphingobium sp.]